MLAVCWEHGSKEDLALLAPGKGQRSQFSQGSVIATLPY